MFGIVVPDMSARWQAPSATFNEKTSPACLSRDLLLALDLIILRIRFCLYLLPIFTLSIFGVLLASKTLLPIYTNARRVHILFASNFTFEWVRAKTLRVTTIYYFLLATNPNNLNSVYVHSYTLINLLTFFKLQINFIDWFSTLFNSIILLIDLNFNMWVVQDADAI